MFAIVNARRERYNRCGGGGCGAARHSRLSIARRGEDGFTLVEILVAIVVLGIASVGIFGMLATLISSSFMHRRQSNVGDVLRAAAERVVKATYVACSDNGYLPTVYSSAFNATVTPSDNSGAIAVTVSKVTTIDQPVNDPSTVTALGPCSAGADPGLQKVAITAAYNGSTTDSQTVWVVKSP